MDGDLNTLGPSNTLTLDAVSRERTDRPHPSRVRKIVWFTIVSLLLLALLGGLYGFNRFKEQAIASYFAGNKPPPPQIAAVTAELHAVPRFAAGIGSLAAVHQVTVTPEVGGRITKILFTAGGTVKADEPLVQINDEPDRGDLANYQAQAHLAQVTLTRKATLAERQFASQDTVDQMQSQLDQAKAQIAKTEAIIAQKQVRAPFGGQLGMRQVELGQYLTPGSPVVTLTDLSHLYVNFTLPSQMRSEIKVGQTVNLTADAYPSQTFTAQVSTIEPQIRSDTRTMAIQATMVNPEQKLLPGMFVSAALVLPKEPDQVVLPETAVDYTLYGDSVYLIREDGTDKDGKPVTKALRTPIKTGTRWDGKVAILDGVKPGDRVVAAGQIKVQNGAPVTVTGNLPPQPPTNPTTH